MDHSLNIFILWSSFNGSQCQWFLIFFKKSIFFLNSINLQHKSNWTENEKSDCRKFGLMHNFVYLHTWVITDAKFSAMQSMLSWLVKILLSLLITFRTNVRMGIIPSPFSLLFAFQLEWSFDNSVDGKSSAVCIFEN